MKKANKKKAKYAIFGLLGALVAVLVIASLVYERQYPLVETQYTNPDSGTFTVLFYEDSVVVDKQLNDLSAIDPGGQDSLLSPALTGKERIGLTIFESPELGDQGLQDREDICTEYKYDLTSSVYNNQIVVCDAFYQLDKPFYYTAQINADDKIYFAIIGFAFDLNEFGEDNQAATNFLRDLDITDYEGDINRILESVKVN